jgi:hypothetical protein
MQEKIEGMALHRINEKLTRKELIDPQRALQGEL